MNRNSSKIIKFFFVLFIILLIGTGCGSGENSSDNDHDNDGVIASIDKCPNTAAGDIVDSNGCSESQKDNDDKPDDVGETDPETDPIINDSDNDGVTDTNDLCLGTQQDETVDIDGCSESQKDNDDKPDDVGETDPETDPINTDSDNDGVTDTNDLCPETQQGETVDSNGCSDIQKTLTWYKDADNDKYSDATEQKSINRPSPEYFLATELISIEGDCNDSDDEINPGATDIFGDDIDYNCDGKVYSVFSVVSQPGSSGYNNSTPYNILIDRPHPVVILTSDGYLHEWNEQIPDTWKPASLDKTELVVIVGDEQKENDQCLYKIYDEEKYYVVNRIEYYRTIIVYSAYTGAYKTSKKLLGGSAGYCPGSTDHSYSKYGSHTKASQLVDYLTEIVEYDTTDLNTVEDNDTTDYSKFRFTGTLKMDKRVLLSAIIQTDNPDFVYAVDFINQSLLKIDINKRSLEQTIPLPVNDPRAMAFSTLDNCIYITHFRSNIIVKYNVSSSTISSFTLSETIGIKRKIYILPALKRILIADSSYLYLIDFETHDVIQKIKPSESRRIYGIENIEVDEIRQKIFISDGYENFVQYSYTENEIIKEQEEYDISFKVMSPDNLTLSDGDTIYSALDINAPTKNWVSDFRIKSWSPDSTLCYGTGTWDTLKIMHGKNHRCIQTLSFTDGGDYSSIVFPANNGTTLVCFSYEDYHNQEQLYNFYFYEKYK